MGRRERPAGAAKGKAGRPSRTEQAEKLKLVTHLCARARVVHGITKMADAITFVVSQDAWAEPPYADRGPPSDTYVANVWKSLNPENVDLCANLANEKVQRTAAEERQAAIQRARETVNRWYGIERQCVLERDGALEREDRRMARLCEERAAKAQQSRMQAEEQLAKCTALIDDESFDSPQLRSEVIAILARNRAHFTADECERMVALFESRAEQASMPRDPNVPEYMQ